MHNSWGKKSPQDFTYRENTEPYFSFDEYWDVCMMLSLGILLKVPDEEFNKIVKVREKVPEKDFLLDFIISYRIDTYEVVEHIMETNPYQTLEKVIKVSKTDKGSALKILQDYLSKQLYKDNKEMFWYGYHKEPKLFFGYWSFESGALVKILGLDDSILKIQKYYPYDMVHWK